MKPIETYKTGMAASDNDFWAMAAAFLGVCMLIVAMLLTAGAALAVFLAPIVLTWQWATGGG